MEITMVTHKELDLILDRLKNDKRADVALLISLVGVLIAIITLFLLLKGA